jgi:pimeloyl-ACP methyl ester carboxylesterase
MVVIPDLPGMGLSDVKPGAYDLPSVSEDIHLLASTVGLKEVDVVGHDWGGAVAAVYALRYRQEYKKLVSSKVLWAERDSKALGYSVNEIQP